jgi:hypothetical protein
VDCSGGPDEEKNPETAFANKKNALLKLAQESPVCKTIVFCNKVLPFPLSLSQNLGRDSLPFSSVCKTIVFCHKVLSELYVLGLSCEQFFYLHI